MGDEAIIAITRQLQMTLRAGDYIGRFGGDEFAIIMSGTPAESAIAAMSRVHERLKTVVTLCPERTASHQRGGCAMGNTVCPLPRMVKSGRYRAL